MSASDSERRFIDCPACGGYGYYDRDDMNFPRCDVCAGYGRLTVGALLTQIAIERRKYREHGFPECGRRALAWGRALPVEPHVPVDGTGLPLGEWRSYFFSGYGFGC